MIRLSFALLLLTLPATDLISADPPTVVSWETHQLSTQFFSEGATVGDFNRDGIADVASGPFWYEGPDFKSPHRFYAQDAFDPHGYSNNFFSYTDDFNKDGWDDILIFGFPGKDASWFENPKGQDRFWPRHKVLDVVENESPTFADLTGDGSREIVCSSGGFFGYAEINRDDPTAPWKFHKISDQSAGGRFTHGLGVGDVDGDGRMDLLEKSGWWQQPASLEGDPVWKKHPFEFAPGRGSAQMFAYDVDGDGDQDVITSLDAHGYGLVWYEQLDNAADGTASPSFEKHTILGSKTSDSPFGVLFSQLHAIDLVDVNGDGLKDIVTGKRWWAHGPRGDAAPNDPAVLYWFELTRPGGDDGDVVWVPHQIDDASGVGTDVRVADLNGDDAVDVIVGNKMGTFVSLQRRESTDAATQARQQPRPLSMNARSASDGLPTNEGLSPADAAAAMTVPEGFRVQLAAGEPMVHQPIAMTFDARGRLWIAEAHTYPVRAAEGEGKDKIIILEDIDGDGVFDKRKVFAEGLNLVSGMEVGFGGVWVGAAPYLMFIPDRDADDRPDSDPEILLDGFGYQDTHETLNAFIWGPDGWLYGCHGVFTHSKVGKPGTPEDQRTPMNCAVWRYHPTRHEFDIFARGTSNPWGVDFNEHGQAMITACVIPHMFHMIQGGRYQRQGGQHFNPYVYDDIKTIADHAHYAGNIRDHAWWGRDAAADQTDTNAAGGGHAHCGAMIYLADNWPAQYRGSIFMANIHGNRINNDILRRNGSGYIASHGADVLFANDRWFRAINMKYGPDGSVYLIDWYDKNACHRRDIEVWDRTNGRVYRVAFGGTDLPRPTFHDASLQDLATAHRSTNEHHVRTSRRLLQERFAADAGVASSPEGAEAIGLLREQAFGSDSVEDRLRAIWTLHAVQQLTEADTIALLDERGHRSEYLRGWAIQLALEDLEVSDSLLQRFSEMARSEQSALVRLYLASALQRLPLQQRWEIAAGLVSHGEDAQDHNLPNLIWYGIEPLVPNNTTRALALAKETRIPKVRQFIYRRAAADVDSIGPLLAELGKTDDKAMQGTILNEVVAAIKSQGRLKMPPGWPAVYAKLSASEDAKIREQSQLITVKFGDVSIFPVLREIAANPKASLPQRTSALDALLTGKDQALVPTLVGLLDDQALRGKAIRGLARYSDDTIADELLQRYPALDSDLRSDAVATLAARTAWADRLIDAVAAGKVDRQELSAATINQIQLLGDAKLLEKVQQTWGTIRSMSADKKQHIAAWKQRLTPEVLSKADRSHGRLVYDNTCGKCHRLFGSGGQIGPDITGSNRADLDYTLLNILDPNALVGRDYQTTMVVTLDGRVINGLLKEENESAIVLQTANERLVIDRDDIDTRQLAETSMMPEGQLDQMKPDEARDLIAYLASATQVPLPGEGPFLDEKTGRVAGAMEGESLRVIEKSAGATRGQQMGAFKADRWSGNDHLWWTGAKPGDTLTLNLPVEKAGEYDVFVAMTKARDYAIVNFAVNAASVPGKHDLYHGNNVISTGPVSLGRHRLNQGDNTLQVSIVGSHPDAVKGFMFGLDYVYLSDK
ncbi:PVC-type heme-binding CxxCH protein [Rosistilla oblonga]|uniref:FG-GAP repeat protein n=1 Tax=Rosistilla oblonga TaxID=2527990 RepID=A0A518ISC7_9BACT|nr:PVC-type heme-binding CxxCH protein [Rosistilla oblonga]QDV55980.1 FG-GAP repeat protein [Rosistilla oblonga]